MKLLGWALILLPGGFILYATVNVVYSSLTDYYVGAELSGAWMILGFFWLVAVIPIGLGIWMVRRDKNSSTHIQPS